jgi:Uma2 family endonuclease
MPAVVVQDLNPPHGVTIPAWVVDFKSFIRWVESEDFPERGRFCYLNGSVWVDLSMEQLFTHNRIKVRITFALEAIVSALASGYVFGDKARLHNHDAELSVEPDAMFVSFEAIRSRRTTLTEGAEDGYVSIDGAPEMVLEIVSDSSEDKDTVELRAAYFDAGVSEFWIVDVRRGSLTFEILKRSARGFTSTRTQTGGWLKSAVFGRSFRITKIADPLGNPQFTLEHRD